MATGAGIRFEDEMNKDLRKTGERAFALSLSILTCLDAIGLLALLHFPLRHLK